VVTEYGVADLRGLNDQDVIAALLNIADSRFQPQLLRAAQAAGKIRRDHKIADRHRHNTPGLLEERFALPRARGLFSDFPFGTDLSGEEVVLAKALGNLKEHTRGRARAFGTALKACAGFATPAAMRPYLDRLGLSAPVTAREWLWQRLLVRELRDLL
jgi:hypothetical protein